MATRVEASRTPMVVIALLLLAPSAGAQGPYFHEPVALDVSIGGDTGRNNGNAVGPFVASDGKRLVAVWNNFIGGSGNLVEIMSSTSTDGEKWSPPKRLSVEGTVNRNPSVAGNGSVWVAAWRHDPAQSSRRIVAAYSTNGEDWSEPVDVIPVDGDQSVNVSPTGVFLIVGTGRGPGSSDTDVLFARSTDPSAGWSAVEILNDDTDSPQTDRHPSLAADGQGRWLAAWDAPKTHSDLEILIARSEDDGVTWSKPQLLLPGFFDLATERANDTAPHVAAPAVPGGHWIVAWDRAEGGALNIFAATSSDRTLWSPGTGQPMVSRPATTYTEFGSGRPVGDGVAWVVPFAGGSSTVREIGAVYSTDDGVTWPRVETLSTVGDGANLAYDGHGKFVRLMTLPDPNVGDADVFYALGLPDPRCGNTRMEGNEQCDPPGDCCSETCRWLGTDTVCRPAAGDCDQAEVCPGNSARCPEVDAKKPPSTLCREAAGACDLREFCTDGGNDCPRDLFVVGETPLCTDHNQCTVTDFCAEGVCQPGEAACDACAGPLVRRVRGRLQQLIEIDCESVQPGKGCSVEAFLLPEASPDSVDPGQCGQLAEPTVARAIFPVLIARTAKPKPFDATGRARVRLKLNKRGKRELRGNGPQRVVEVRVTINDRVYALTRLIRLFRQGALKSAL